MTDLYDVTDMLNVSMAIGEWEDNPRDNRAIGEAVLDDVAPRLVAQALRNAAQQIRDGYTCDPDKTPRDEDPECVAFDDAIRYLRATADEIEADRVEDLAQRRGKALIRKMAARGELKARSPRKWITITCARCGEPVLGYARIDGKRYCHTDERSCCTEQLTEDET